MTDRAVRRGWRCHLPLCLLLLRTSATCFVRLSQGQVVTETYGSTSRQILKERHIKQKKTDIEEKEKRPALLWSIDGCQFGSFATVETKNMDQSGGRVGQGLIVRSLRLQIPEQFRFKSKDGRKCGKMLPCKILKLFQIALT